jgi:tRNA pseudouridine32 synthase/23S rRNA pseudouridine746 synthase
MENTPEILWADASLLVINKPAGLRSLPDGYDPARPHLRLLLEPQFGRLWMVHRLDKETSGVLLLARSAEAHRALNTMFERHQVRKWYHAIAAGCPEWNEQSVRLPLRPNGDRRHRTVVDHSRGKPAVTHLCLLQRFSSASLIEAQPETGRTHQIRAHLAVLGLPLLGDALYGAPAMPELPLDTLALHAFALELIHPESGQLVRFEAPYPPAFQAALNHLRTLV